MLTAHSNRSPSPTTHLPGSPPNLDQPPPKAARVAYDRVLTMVIKDSKRKENVKCRTALAVLQYFLRHTDHTKGLTTTAAREAKLEEVTTQSNQLRTDILKKRKTAEAVAEQLWPSENDFQAKVIARGKVVAQLLEKLDATEHMKNGAIVRFAQLDIIHSVSLKWDGLDRPERLLDWASRAATYRTFEEFAQPKATPDWVNNLKLL